MSDEIFDYVIIGAGSAGCVLAHRLTEDGKHTVLLSTHILPEVEKVCERVMIINKGRVRFDDTLKAMQLALTLGMDRRFVIHTPLMWIDKAATFAMAEDIGGAPLIELLLAETHTCYLGDREHRHAWGFGCGECPACRLRAEGFAKWNAAA